jgi:hypothetical protein
VCKGKRPVRHEETAGAHPQRTCTCLNQARKMQWLN